jgi:hypothetical protein
MGSSANSTGQDDRLNNLLTCLERAEKARDERRRVGMQTDGPLSAPCRDLPFAGAANVLGDQLPPVSLRPGMASDADLERIRTVTYGLQEGRPVRHLPRATQLSRIPGVPSIDSQRLVPTRIIDVDKLMPMSTLRPARRAFSGGTAFLFVGTIAAAWAGYLVVASWPPAMDFVERPSRASSEPQLVPLSALAQAVLPSTRLKGLTTGSEAAPEPHLTMLSEDKPPENGIEASLPQTLSATKYKATTGEGNVPGSISAQQTSPKSGADAALVGQDTKPLIERESLVSPASVQVSTCFPSASAVRQEYPEAWPSWTLRAAGHEGTKCWHAATRATVHEHRGDTIAKKETVGTMEKLASPAETK